MPSKWLLLTLLALHLLLTVGAIIAARKRGRYLGAARVLFGLLLPLCGPVTLWMFAITGEPDESIADDLKRNRERHAALVNPGTEGTRVVPLEEAFLINTPKKRRELMMNLLRSDPRKYLDLLLLARFNEDPETAHYATATLTEVQRQMQLELQQAQMQAQKRPKDAQIGINYVRLLQSYINSGLLEGQLLSRQQNVLEHALEALPEAAITPETLTIRVGNLLSLKRAPEARACAEEMLTRWPEDEAGWLQMLRVCVETHDKHGLNALVEREKGATVAWSTAGLERMHYFANKEEEGALADIQPIAADVSV